MIISRRMRWVGHVAHMGTGELYVWFWWINLRERTRLEDLGVNGNIKKDLQEVGSRASAGLSWLRIGTGSGIL